MQIKSPSYRADIDGLRGLAILLVVGFHTFPQWVPGGFIGVDIFFVISGFLITGIIFKNMQNGSFHFGEFYARRIRRIFPALIIVLLGCLTFGWFSLLTDEYKELGRHIAASVTFLQNYNLWSETHYFAGSADAKPLLHLWSLAIEEQFYLVFPLLLFVAFKLRCHKILLLSLLLISFAINILSFGKYPPGYYFFASEIRFWELLLGGALAIFPITNRLSRTQGEFGTVIGMLMIMVGVGAIRSTDPYPNWWALLPTLGAALIILAGSQAWLNRVAFSNRVLVWTGLISFPLYLWHWSLFSFTRIVGSGRPTGAGSASLLVIGFLMAWLTYKFIEVPIRFGNYRRWKTAALCSLLAMVGMFGYLINHNKGYPERLVNDLNSGIKSAKFGRDSDNFLESKCAVPANDVVKIGRCMQDKRETPRYVVLGDSKAHTLLPGLLRHSKAGHRWMFVGNLPLLSDSPEYSKQKEETTIALNSIIADPNLKVVVIAGAMRRIFKVEYQGTSDISALDASPYLNAAVEAFTNSITLLRKAGKKVIFLEDLPVLPDPKDCMAGGRKTSLRFISQLFGPIINKECELSLDEHIKRNKKYRQMVEMLGRNIPELKIVDSSDLICDTRVRVCAATINGSHLYSISDHLSDLGNSFVAMGLLPIVQRLDEEPGPAARK